MKAKKKSHKTELAKIIKNLIGKHHWKHRNTIFLIISIYFSYAILTLQAVQNLILNLGNLGYLGSFVVGIFFTYALTTVPATASFFILGKTLNPLLIALAGATGTLISEYIIYRFVKGHVIKEIESFSPGIRKNIHNMVKNLKKSTISKNFIPFIAGLIIASPLPDELAAGLLGMARFKMKRFLLYAYFFNFIGILIIASAAKVL